MRSRRSTGACAGTNARAFLRHAPGWEPAAADFPALHRTVRIPTASYVIRATSRPPAS